MQEQALYNMLKPMPEKLLKFNLQATHLIDYKETQDNLNLLINDSAIEYSFSEPIILSNPITKYNNSPLIIILKANNFARKIMGCDLNNEEAKLLFKNNLDNFRYGIFLRLQIPNTYLYSYIINFDWDENYEYLYFEANINGTIKINKTTIFIYHYIDTNCDAYINKIEFYYLFHVGDLLNIVFNFLK